MDLSRASRTALHAASVASIVETPNPTLEYSMSTIVRVGEGGWSKLPVDPEDAFEKAAIVVAVSWAISRSVNGEVPFMAIQIY